MGANARSASFDARPEHRGEGDAVTSDAVTAADAIRGSKPMICQRCRGKPAKLYFRGLNICWICFSAHPS